MHGSQKVAPVIAAMISAGFASLEPLIERARRAAREPRPEDFNAHPFEVRAQQLRLQALRLRIHHHIGRVGQVTHGPLRVSPCRRDRVVRPAAPPSPACGPSMR